MFVRSSTKLRGVLRWCQRNFKTGHQNHIAVSTTFNSSTTNSLSSQSLPEPTEQQTFVSPSTSIVNPAEHSDDEIGLWYTIPKDEFDTIFSTKHILPLKYVDIQKSFREADIMVRRPAVSVINYIKQLDLKAIPPPKFFFYGNFGCGKTMSLAHVTHYLHKSDFVIVQAPWFHRWLNQPDKYLDECLPSLTVPERWDQINDATAWIKFFRAQNIAKLNQPEFILSKDYQFSTREICKKGDTLLSVLDIGINRTRLAADCALTVATEVKILANEDKCKVAVVMDGINAAFTSTSKFMKEQQHVIELKRYIKPHELTLCQAFLQFFYEDWNNGVIVGTVDSNVNKLDKREMITPRYLLEGQGFEKLDPFVAVPVPEYTDKECDSAYLYYASKKFINRSSALTPEGRKFIRISTAKNPLKILETILSL